MAQVDVTRIASNIGALNALNSLQNINAKLSMHQTRLSTGKRINSAMDDPAGLTIATKMMARAEGFRASLDNISDAKNMLSVAEGGLSTMTDIMIQMRTKATQAASDTLGNSERATIQTQLSAYSQQLQDLVDQTKWNGVKLLDNSTGSKQFQTGVDEGEYTTWTLPAALDPAALSLSTKVTTPTVSDVSGQVGADFVIADVIKGTYAKQSAVTSGQTELTTGDYGFKILDKSSLVGTSKQNIDSSSALISGVSGFTDSAAGAAVAGKSLVSGHYSLTFTNIATTASATALTVSITNLDDSSWGTNGTQSFSQSFANNVTTLALNNTGAIGLSLNTSDVTAVQTSQTMSFEYIKAGDVKVQLQDAQGSAMTVVRDAAVGAGVKYTAQSAYVAANSQYDSGRGASMKSAAWAGVSTTSGTTLGLTYQRVNNFSVNVSTANKAAAYMTTVNSALDKVTGTLSDLGSLMARLTFKEDQASLAKVNVEGAYNRIMNANMAEEQVNASKYTILQQTATAMLAQANAAPQSLLTLFR